jgi:hypothetical protein
MIISQLAAGDALQALEKYISTHLTPINEIRKLELR